MNTTPRPTAGLFVTFEGIDGSGKSTQLRLLAERLVRAGVKHTVAVEPGGTSIGRKIRAILLDRAHDHLTPRAELLLYFASRAQNVEEVIRPALARGEVVLCDRFTDSTLAYQGYGRGLGAEPVVALDRIACQGLEPHLTLLLDIDPMAGLARARGRGEDLSNRMDELPLEFYEKTRGAFLQIAAEHPSRIQVVDANAPLEQVSARVWAHLERLLAEAQLRGV